MNSKISRRSFIGKSSMAVAGLSVFPKFPNFSPNDTINLGIIGPGRRGINLVKNFLNIEGVNVIAGSDVYGRKRERFEKVVKDHYREKNRKVDIKTYENYHDLLDRKDIDAVIIATPDHWHALQTIDACKAEKDIYLEKPVTLTIKEGQEIVKATREHNRILSVGSQQRSDPAFQYAVKLVQEGKLGIIEKINAYVGGPPVPYDLPREAIPSDLNWDMWLGPNPYVHFNNELNPPISLNPPLNEEFWGAWRWYKETGGGFTTDWGAHMFDIAQWAIGKQYSGPVRVIPPGSEGAEFLTFIYDNGVVMTEERFNEYIKGVKFRGTEGWLEISRNHILTSDESLMPAEGELVQNETHTENFIRTIRERKDPVVPVEIGHRTCTTCTLGNIAYDLGRPVNWNPDNESFVNDPQAELYMHRHYRKGYGLG
ncbi:MAG: Gfo/Idh/MocA family protein [bacterium]